MYKKKKNIYKSFVKNHFTKYPTPTNLSYFWNFGFISSFCLFVQFLSGIFLAMHYNSDVSLAFSSIEHIMRDVNYGWFIRYLHANGASFFFIVVYYHIGRNLYFQRYEYLNLKVWNSGIIIFFLMIITAFIGYVLPWGQMSFWGATVITNLFSAIPFIGTRLVYWLWGGFSVGAPTLSRFFSLHYLLPFVILFFVIVHIGFLHEKGSSNPSMVSTNINREYVPLHPYFIIKDFLGLSLFCLLYLNVLYFLPDVLGHSDNYIEANPLVTPPHIVPEWYFLPFYAILRSIPNKLIGVLFMAFSILIFLFLPIVSKFMHNKFSTTDKISYVYNHWVHKFASNFFFMVFILLGWIGSKPVEAPFVNLGAILVFLYFFLLVVVFVILKPWFIYRLDNYIKTAKKKDNFDMFTGFIFLNDYIFNFNGFFNVDFSFFFLYIFLLFLLLNILVCISFFSSNQIFGKKNLILAESFECGFNPFKQNPSAKFTFHAFKVAIIFLLFDLEIIFLLPWIVCLEFFSLNGFFFFFFSGLPFLFLIFFGLLYEYVNRVTDWKLFLI